MSPRVSLANACLTLATSNKLGCVGGSSEKPCTSAPMLLSQSANHPPLKPVWPVTNTRRPFQKAGVTLTPIASMAHGQSAIVLLNNSCPGAYPWVARSRDDGTPPTAFLRRAFEGADPPTAYHRSRYSRSP